MIVYLHERNAVDKEQKCEYTFTEGLNNFTAWGRDSFCEKRRLRVLRWAYGLHTYYLT
jgi:hypothetical protein